MPSRRMIVGFLALAPAGLVLARPARAAEPMVFQPRGVAIHGIDPVAYFAEQGPVPGNPDIGHDWNGARWLFASEANRATFAAEPERHAPAFGGYCAFAASRGYLAPTIPEAWSIHEGRLFLNASLRARRLWSAELPDVIAAGEANWPAILG
ncbi:YHS domain-containing (seleno)protein [Roseicyclus marinus]|uniref:YHS domain-containing (seleno)protein n=1 Tax=Roseicyclus marinus TaxID=2161673 RepID=UPI00240EF208|nr:YHS domain-containing (seleno)protein [Roseicyclus marinus]MDG3042251.1 YHS domain-containing (seleno)protein [Roseicyclus marinus]